MRAFPFVSSRACRPVGLLKCFVVSVPGRLSAQQLVPDDHVDLLPCELRLHLPHQHSPGRRARRPTANLLCTFDTGVSDRPTISSGDTPCACWSNREHPVWDDSVDARQLGSCPAGHALVVRKNQRIEPATLALTKRKRDNTPPTPFNLAGSPPTCSVAPYHRRSPSSPRAWGSPTIPSSWAQSPPG